MSKTVYEGNNGDVVITRSGAMVLTSSAKMATPSASAKDTVEKYESTQPGNQESYLNIAMWGTNNLLPQEMIADTNNTGVLFSAVSAKARTTMGKGARPAIVEGTNSDGNEKLKFVSDNKEINAFIRNTNVFKNSFALAEDSFRVGNAFVQLLFNPNRTKLLGYKRIDPSKCRFESVNPETGRIDHVVISGDWRQYQQTSEDGSGKVDDKHVQKIPLLDRDFPLFDLQSRTSGTTFMLALQPPLSGTHYYAPSPWYSAKRWVKIAQNVPQMKEAMFKNQITLKYLVNFHPEFWVAMNKDYKSLDDPKQREFREKYYDMMDNYLTGVDNTFKSFMSTQVYDPYATKFCNAVEVTTIDDKIKDGKMLIDSAAANIEILLPLMINAALLGVDMPGGGAYSGGAGSGSNIREAYLVQVMLHEFERTQISLPLEIAQTINGWPEEIVWRYPNPIVTTMNTGANTQYTS
jgi:hypothetical protein